MPMLFMCEGGVLFCCFFSFLFFFAGWMEDFDLGLTNILTQIMDEDIWQMEGMVALTRESQETGPVAEFEWKGKAVCLL